MSVQLPRYRDMRDSGLPWAPTIPDHWDIRRNGGLFGQRVETGYPDLPILEVSLRTGVRVRDMENLKRKQVMGQREKYKRAVKGDIAYNMMRMWQGALGVAPADGLISPAYVVARPYAGVDSAYYAYLYRTGDYLREVNKYSRGIVSDRNRLYWVNFKQMPALLPPPEEQTQIVRYLRAQDAKIARFIRDKRRLIEVLNEQKQTLIHRAVTRGLDPNVKLKPSGVEWLGEVPAHWCITRLRSCVTSIKNGVWGSDPTPSNVPDHMVCVRVADFDMTNLGVSTLHLTVRAVSPNEHSGRLLRPGDLILEKSGGGEKTTVGRVVAFNLSKTAVCSNFLARLSVDRENVLPEYLLVVMNHLHRTGVVIPFIKQTTGIQNLDAGQYLSTGVALPSTSEQLQILAWISEQHAPIDAVLMAAAAEMERINEYRDRLIADVVTGQIDVRGWLPEPDDVIDEAALSGDEGGTLEDEGVEDDDGHE